MNETIHIVAKDARRLRWALFAWTIVVAIKAVVNVVRPALDLQGMAMSMVAGQLATLVATIDVALLVLLVSWLVHEDPATDREAFWITRPIHPARLAAAKLTLAATALVLLPVAGAWITMAAFGVNAYDMLRATPSILLNQSLWMVALTAAATLTPSMTRYLLVLVGAGAAYVLAISAMLAGALLFAEVRESPPHAEVGDPTPTIVATTLAIMSFLWVVAHQYRRRRTRPGATIAVAASLAIVAVPVFWPSHRAADPDPGAWASNQSRTAVIVGSEPPDVSDDAAVIRRTISNKRVAVPVHLSGIPGNMFVRAVESRSRLDLAGTSLTSDQTGSALVRTAGIRNPEQAALQGALGSVRLAERSGGDDYDQWPVLLTISDDAFSRHARVSGRLTTTLDFHLARTTIAGAVPLRQGSILRDDTRRIEIVGIEPRVGGCTVMLRQVSIAPLFQRRVFENEMLVLRNTARGEAVQGDMESMQRGSAWPLSFLLSIAMGAGGYGADGSDDNGFGIRAYAYRYPSGRPSTPVIDASWLAGAELVRVTTRYAGHVTRALAIDDFVMAR